MDIEPDATRKIYLGSKIEIESNGTESAAEKIRYKDRKRWERQPRFRSGQPPGRIKAGLSPESKETQPTLKYGKLQTFTLLKIQVDQR